MIKKQLVKLAQGLGYDIKKRPKADLNIYQQLYSKESLENKRFYNVGAGGFSHPYWTNVDFLSDWYSHYDISPSAIHHDLMSLEDLPIPSDCGEVVYSSHTVEHITDAAAQKLFNEAYRILKKGGILRITTPNINLEYRAYQDDDRNYFYWIDNYSRKEECDRVNINKPMNQASTEQIFLHHFASNASELHKDGAEKRISDEELKQVFAEKPLAEALNYCTSKCEEEIQSKYPGNHINWWNPDKMTRMFQEAGFSKIFRSGYGQSFSPVMRDLTLFDNTHPKISLYMEAVK
ncbi:MAG: methyltransferase domain-containing protein [Bacteroidota bacterium]